MWDNGHINDLDDGTPPSARFSPRVNSMAYFRGDAVHQVRSYRTNSTTTVRAGLVLEQYKVPEKLLPMVHPFHFEERTNMGMM